MNADNILRSPYKLKLPTDIGDLYSYVCEKNSGAQDGTITLNEVFSNKRSITLKQAKLEIENIAQNLFQHHGFQPGDYFGCYSLNSIDYLLVVLAVWKLRGIHVGINPFLKPGKVLNEVQRQLSVSDCKFLLVDPMTAPSAMSSIRGTKVQKVFVNGESSEEGCIPLSSLLEKPAKSVSLPSSPVQMDDVCAVMFSSGTSGLPKACELPVRMFVTHLHNQGPEFNDNLTRYVIYQPLCGPYGIGMSLTSFHNKVTIYLMDRFDLMTYLKYTAKYKIPLLALVPPIAVQLLKMDLASQVDLSCVKTIYCGGAILSREICDGLIKKLGVTIYQVYGLTEASVVAMVPSKKFKGKPVPYGTVGMPVCGCEIKVCNLDDRTTALGPDVRGEVCIRTPSLMLRYINPPPNAPQAIDAEGWFHTGDMGYVDKKGFLFLVERLSDIIKYKTNYVAPSEIDNVLLTHPSIADAGTAGVPSVEAGEVPFALVVLKPDTSLTEEELQHWVAEQVGDAKRLRGGVRFVPAIPKAPTGKILRREIKLRYRDDPTQAQSGS